MTRSPQNSTELGALQRAEAAGAQVMAARNALRKGDRAGAKELIKQAFVANPGDITAVELLGDIFLEEGETEQALRLFERAAREHPHHVAFEEKLAVCRLDLAEMEADKLARQNLLDGQDQSKIFERSPSRALGLSLLLPGAGQFYNDENERGTAYLAAGLVSCLAWFYPLWSSLSRLPKAQRLDFGGAIRAMSGVEATAFYLGAVAWSGVYAASVVAASTSAKRFNDARRAQLGL